MPLSQRQQREEAEHHDPRSPQPPSVSRRVSVRPQAHGLQSAIAARDTERVRHLLEFVPVEPAASDVALAIESGAPRELVSLLEQYAQPVAAHRGATTSLPAHAEEEREQLAHAQAAQQAARAHFGSLGVAGRVPVAPPVDVMMHAHHLGGTLRLERGRRSEGLIGHVILPPSVDGGVGLPAEHRRATHGQHHMYAEAELLGTPVESGGRGSPSVIGESAGDEGEDILSPSHLAGTQPAIASSGMQTPSLAGLRGPPVPEHLAMRAELENQTATGSADLAAAAQEAMEHIHLHV